MLHDSRLLATYITKLAMRKRHLAHVLNRNLNGFTGYLLLRHCLFVRLLDVRS